MVTTVDVQNWINSHVGKWIDFDGAYGAQCMDLSVQYAHDLWGFRLTGNAENLRNQALPAGWQRIQNSASFVPKLGDIFIWYDAQHPYGHTGIVRGGNMNTYDVLDQNTAGTNGGAGSEAKFHTYTYAHFWGVVRPPISAASGGGSTTPTSPSGKAVAQKGTFKANGSVNIRRNPSTKGN
ncbi:CHAP domain-containing protein, partial [Herbiconiux daphne]